MPARYHETKSSAKFGTSCAKQSRNLFWKSREVPAPFLRAPTASQKSLPEASTTGFSQRDSLTFWSNFRGAKSTKSTAGFTQDHLGIKLAVPFLREQTAGRARFFHLCTCTGRNAAPVPSQHTPLGSQDLHQRELISNALSANAQNLWGCLKHRSRCALRAWTCHKMLTDHFLNACPQLGPPPSPKADET